MATEEAQIAGTVIVQRAKDYCQYAEKLAKHTFFARFEKQVQSCLVARLVLGRFRALFFFEAQCARCENPLGREQLILRL